MLNRLTVSTLLKAVILTTAFCVVVGFSLNAWEAWGRLQMTGRISVITDASANMGRPVDAHHLMLCTDNEAGASQFPSTEVDTPAVNPDVAHACAMELCCSCPVIEFGSRTTSRLPCTAMTWK